jgi:hypothetical protein
MRSEIAPEKNFIFGEAYGRPTHKDVRGRDDDTSPFKTPHFRLMSECGFANSDMEDVNVALHLRKQPFLSEHDANLITRVGSPAEM